MRSLIRSALIASVAAVAVAAPVVAAVLAEATKVELKDFTCKSTYDEAPKDAYGYNESESKLFFYVHGTASAKLKAAADGKYTLTLEMSCDEADKEKAKVKISIGDTVVEKEFELKDTAAKEYTFDVELKKGDNTLAVQFLNDKYKEGEYDLNFYLHGAKFEAKAAK